MKTDDGTCQCGAKDWEGYYCLGIIDGILFFVCRGCERAVPRALFSPHLTAMSESAASNWNYMRERRLNNDDED